MKRIIISIVIFLLSIAIGEAGEIDGKWGLGVGIYGHFTSPNISVMRGISNRTALLGSVSLGFSRSAYRSERDSTEVIEDTRWHTSAGISGEWRRYTRAGKTISPYFGLGPSFGYSISESSRSDRTSWQTGFGFSFGAEYFVNEHLTLSTHLPVLRYTFRKDRSKHGSDTEYRDTSHQVSFALNPSLVVRLYF